MKGLIIEDGLLLTEMKITYNGKALELDRVLVDTSARESVLSRANALDLNMPLGGEDSPKGSSNKQITAISVGPLKIVDFPIYVKDIPDGKLDGILGLDFLKRVGAKINLDSMTLSGSRVI
ncbi:putative aspartyl protease [Evansella vedderi]|uniref:Aspartyl protease n=1 Tax=Evansella vedderi TaxID=38282 RepID=A0ABU0A4Q8_9BACI|nr:aspartyl protease family protein [Evansella vedderi]MDQ0257320.1 putative aspartyl protease [Evansella vedderi]